MKKWEMKVGKLTMREKHKANGENEDKKEIKFEKEGKVRISFHAFCVEISFKRVHEFALLEERNNFLVLFKKM